eukprot:GHVU01023032.1.p1 GENE.GHVU01023032.1~~GHVU01023032.1.p1  ORF type:complete len:451 (+),score=84.36 GHVU01023032.1:168-1355(+)
MATTEEEEEEATVVGEGHDGDDGTPPRPPRVGGGSGVEKEEKEDVVTTTTTTTTMMQRSRLPSRDLDRLLMSPRTGLIAAAHPIPPKPTTSQSSTSMSKSHPHPPPPKTSGVRPPKSAPVGRPVDAPEREQPRVVAHPGNRPRRAGTLMEAKPEPDHKFKMEHLSCFVGGLFALAHQTLPPDACTPLSLYEGVAIDATLTCAQLFLETGGFDELMVNSTLHYEEAGLHPEYLLRPEIVESLFYLHYYTGDPRYREVGWHLWGVVHAIGRANKGFTRSRRRHRLQTGPPNSELFMIEQTGIHESHFVAETLKYFYLLFAPPDLMDLRVFVLNTEAHPIRRVPGGLPEGLRMEALAARNVWKTFEQALMYHQRCVLITESKKKDQKRNESEPAKQPN